MRWRGLTDPPGDALEVRQLVGLPIQPHLALQDSPLVQAAGQRVEQGALASAAGACSSSSAVGGRGGTVRPGGIMTQAGGMTKKGLQQAGGMAQAGLA